MDERKKNNHPWDDGVYGTGRTEPPKSHGGTVALLLILIIFLCGIITVLGILNVRLFQKLNTQRESEQSISFAAGAALPAETDALPTESLAETPGEVTHTIDLQECPQGAENVPTEGGLSLQEIYSRNIDSVVSITSTGQGTTATGTGVILTEDGYIDEEDFKLRVTKSFYPYEIVMEAEFSKESKIYQEALAAVKEG